MEELGLAQQMVNGSQPMRDVNQIVMMIKRGVSPEELVQQGIPVELVQQAMEIINKEVTQVPDEQAGLANALLPRN